jgi:hypothetical protein
MPGVLRDRESTPSRLRLQASDEQADDYPGHRGERPPATARWAGPSSLSIRPARADARGHLTSSGDWRGGQTCDQHGHLRHDRSLLAKPSRQPGQSCTGLDQRRTRRCSRRASGDCFLHFLSNSQETHRDTRASYESIHTYISFTTVRTDCGSWLSTTNRRSWMRCQQFCGTRATRSRKRRPAERRCRRSSTINRTSLCSTSCFRISTASS